MTIELYNIVMLFLLVGIVLRIVTKILKEKEQKMRKKTVWETGFIERYMAPVLYTHGFTLVKGSPNREDNLIMLSIKELPDWDFALYGDDTWGKTKDIEVYHFTAGHKLIDKPMKKRFNSNVMLDTNIIVDTPFVNSAQGLVDLVKFIAEHPDYAYCRDLKGYNYNLCVLTPEEILAMYNMRQTKGDVNGKET